MRITRRYDQLVLGAGVAGVTAADTLRQADHFASIAIVGDEPYLMYYRPRLPGYVGGHVARESILERHHRWAEQRRIDTFLSERVVGLNPDDHSVDLEGGVQLRYRSLLLATGARPRRLGVTGEDLAGALPLWRLADAEAILAALPGASRAVTVGGGFIGAELTEALRLRGLEVTYLCRGPWWRYPLLDEIGGRMVQNELRENGVDVRFNTSVSALAGLDGHVSRVVTNRGDVIGAQIVTVSLGPTWDVDYLKGSGIALGRGVLTDRWLRTNQPDVWAAGAIADVDNPAVGKRVNLHNVFTAALQGRMAALGMLGRPQQLLRAPQYGFRLFGLFLTFVGVVDTTDPSFESQVSDRSPHSYARIFVRDGKVAGALLINSTRAGEVRRLVEQHAPPPVNTAWLLARLTA